MSDVDELLSLIQIFCRFEGSKKCRFADEPKFTILMFASTASLFVLAMFALEKSGLEGRSKSPFMPLISIPAYLFSTACRNTCEKLQEGQPKVEKDNSGFFVCEISKALSPTRPTPCFKNSRRFFIHLGLGG
jgi:hypothetical protein